MTTIAKLFNAQHGLTIEIVEGMTQGEIRAKTVENGYPVGKTSLSNLLSGKVQATGGWELVKMEATATPAQEAMDLGANAAPVDAAPAAPVDAAPAAPVDAAPVATKKPATQKTAAVRYERDETIKTLMSLSDHDPVLKEAPTETYVTLKLNKARIQATVGVRGVTLMLFPLKGLVLQEISEESTGWVVKAQYAKVGVYAPEKVADALKAVQAEIDKLA